MKQDSGSVLLLCAKGCASGNEVEQAKPTWKLSLQSCPYPWKIPGGSSSHYLSVEVSWRDGVIDTVVAVSFRTPQRGKVIQPIWSKLRIATHVRLTLAVLQAATSLFSEILIISKFSKVALIKPHLLEIIFIFSLLLLVTPWSLEKVLGGKGLCFVLWST